MPKLKTHSGAAKRLKVSKNGKVKYQKAFKRHLLENKNAKRKRQATNAGVLSPSHDKQVRQLLPYAF